MNILPAEIKDSGSLWTVHGTGRYGNSEKLMHTCETNHVGYPRGWKTGLKIQPATLVMPDEESVNVLTSSNFTTKITHG